MKKFTIHLVLALVIAFGIVLNANSQSAKSSKDLPNLYQIAANLYRGGQPTEVGIKELQKLGVKTVIDLRDNDERAKNEEKLVKAAGMRFINVPLDNWFEPNSVFLDDLMRHFGLAENQPVFIHCKRGSDRTGVAIAVYRITHDGWTDKQASDEAKKFGLGWWQVWMKDFIHDYYRDYKQKTHKP